MIGVVDTSSLIRLFIPDGPSCPKLEGFFRKVEQGEDVALAPELLLAETANVLNKKRKLGELSKEESEELLSDIMNMPIRYISHHSILPLAFNIAMEQNLTVYDALYAALAINHGAVVFTSDKCLNSAIEKLNLLPM